MLKFKHDCTKKEKKDITKVLVFYNSRLEMAKQSSVLVSFGLYRQDIKVNAGC